MYYQPVFRQLLQLRYIFSLDLRTHKNCLTEKCLGDFKTPVHSEAKVAYARSRAGPSGHVWCVRIFSRIYLIPTV